MLYPALREIVKSYTFVTRTSFKNVRFYIYYMKEGKEVHKVLPYRATKEQLQNCIEAIKEDCGYNDRKMIIDKKVLDAMKAEQAVVFSHGDK